MLHGTEILICRTLFLVLSFWALASCSDEPMLEERPETRSAEEGYRVSEYVGAKTCAECHSEAHAKWKESHHFHAMEFPTEKTVRADFNDSVFENYGITTKFFREGEKFMVETENQDGEMEVFEVAYTFGWEPLQQYLVKFPDGRMQVLPTCWDVEKKEWYHLYPDERIAPDDPLFWTRSMQNWDHMCADCHSTNLRKVFRALVPNLRDDLFRDERRMRILSRSRAPARRICPFRKGLAKHAGFRSGGRQQYERRSN